MFCTAINVDALEYKSPANNKSGGKVVHVSTIPGSIEYKDRIRFQMSEDEHTNLQSSTWGLSTPMNGQDPNRRTLEVTIESPALLTFLQKLDARNMTVAHERCESWFKKQMDMDQIKNMYVPLVKPPQKEGMKPTVRVKVKCGGGRETNIFDVQRAEGNTFEYNKTSHQDLTKNTKCMVMVETVGLWFMSRQFGMSLNASDILVWPSKQTSGIKAFTFSSDNMDMKERASSHVPYEEMTID